jgi:hypothetical protein
VLGGVKDVAAPISAGRRLAQTRRRKQQFAFGSRQAAEIEQFDVRGGKLFLHCGEQTVGGQYSHRTRDANLSIGCRRDVPPLGQAAQFRQPEGALHARGRSQSERSLGRNRAPLREHSSQIARQDLIGLRAYGEASGQRKCG